MNREISVQTALLALASLLCILFIKQVSFCLNQLITWHSLLSKDLAVIFSGGEYGLLIRRVLAMALVPAGITTAIGGVYWLIKREMMPYVFHLFWLTWLVLLTGLSVHA